MAAHFLKTGSVNKAQIIYTVLHCLRMNCFEFRTLVFARCDNELAEAAALLVLRKTIESVYHDEDEDTGGMNEA